MSASSRFLIAVFCWLALAGLAPREASTAQLPQPGDHQIRLNIPTPAPLPPNSNRRITLDVVVTDRSGKPVKGLEQQDFTVLNDKKPQTILSFREAAGTGAAAEPAVRALLVIDAVNNSEEQVAFERQQVAKFLRQGSGELPLPMSVALVADSDMKQSAFTRDRNAVAEALNAQPSGFRAHNRDQGIYGAEDRTDSSLKTLEALVTAHKSQPGRTLMIWLGRGWPYLEGPNVDLTPTSARAMFRYIVWLSTQGRESHITLYNVNALASDQSLGQTFYYEHFLKGVGSAGNIQGGNAALQVFAIQSGGRVLNRSNEIVDALGACLADANAHYTLAFDAPAGSHPDEYHSLQVKVDKPNLTARMRTGYYAQP